MSKIKFTGIIFWVKEQYENERKEFERAGRAVSNKNNKIIQENITYLKDSYKKSNIVSLSDQAWQKMQNTDSWKTDTFTKILNAFSNNNEKRDIGRILSQFEMGRIKCPIAYKRDDNVLVLIGGNTRLMLCRVLGIRPNIVIIDTDW
jgi:hypothetical protein